MIFLEVSLEEWSKKHKIQVVKCTCPTCGLEQETTVPVVTSKSFGLVTPPHECDDPKQGYTFVGKGKYKQILQNTNQIFN